MNPSLDLDSISYQILGFTHQNASPKKFKTKKILKGQGNDKTKLYYLCWIQQIYERIGLKLLAKNQLFGGVLK